MSPLGPHHPPSCAPPNHPEMAPRTPPSSAPPPSPARTRQRCDDGTRTHGLADNSQITRHQLHVTQPSLLCCKDRASSKVPPASSGVPPAGASAVASWHLATSAGLKCSIVASTGSSVGAISLIWYSCSTLRARQHLLPSTSTAQPPSSLLPLLDAHSVGSMACAKDIKLPILMQHVNRCYRQ